MTAPYALPVDPTRVEVRRICAWTIDLLMFLALVFGVLFATGGIDIQSKQFDTTEQAVQYCNSIDKDDGRRACSPYQDEAVVVHAKGNADPVWLINTVFYVLLQGLTGGSIGKLLLGLRVVDADGQIAGVAKSFVRTLLWVVDAITCGLPIVGGSLMVTKAGHQRFGDRVAGTYVVRKESVGVPVVIPPPQAPVPYAFPLPPPGYAPPTGYGPPPAGPASSAPPPYEAPGTDGPHWDDDRDTYIQFDRAVDMWVQWDESAQHWRPIET